MTRTSAEASRCQNWRRGSPANEGNEAQGDDRRPEGGVNTVDISVRLVERPLNERPLKPQTDGLRDDSGLYRLSITDTGLEMMTAMVGQGLRPTQRRFVGQFLREAMNGDSTSLQE